MKDYLSDIVFKERGIWSEKCQLSKQCAARCDRPWRIAGT